MLGRVRHLRDNFTGTYTWCPATVTLTGLTPYGSGLAANADMTVTARNSPYQPGPFTHGLVP
jgi:hypothetical protein